MTTSIEHQSELPSLDFVASCKNDNLRAFSRSGVKCASFLALSRCINAVILFASWIRFLVICNAESTSWSCFAVEVKSNPYINVILDGIPDDVLVGYIRRPPQEH